MQNTPKAIPEKLKESGMCTREKFHLQRDAWEITEAIMVLKWLRSNDYITYGVDATPISIPRNQNKSDYWYYKVQLNNATPENIDLSNNEAIRFVTTHYEHSKGNYVYAFCCKQYRPSPKFASAIL